MLLYIDDYTLEIFSANVYEGSCEIITDTSIDGINIRNLIMSANTITAIQDDKTTTIPIGCVYNHSIIYEDHIKHIFTIPTKKQSEVNLILEQAITNVELALCEIYESMEV